MNKESILFGSVDPACGNPSNHLFPCNMQQGIMFGVFDWSLRRDTRKRWEQSIDEWHSVPAAVSPNLLQKHRTDPLPEPIFIGTPGFGTRGFLWTHCGEPSTSRSQFSVLGVPLTMILMMRCPLCDDVHSFEVNGLEKDFSLVPARSTAAVYRNSG